MRQIHRIVGLEKNDSFCLADDVGVDEQDQALSDQFGHVLDVEQCVPGSLDLLVLFQPEMQLISEDGETHYGYLQYYSESD